MGFWNDASLDLVRTSLQTVLVSQDQARDELYAKWSDYYDGSIEAIEKYFLKRSRETEARFRDRPKISIPLARTLADVHADALVKGMKIKVKDERSDELYQEHLTANDWDAYKSLISQITSVYGACGTKPFIHDDGTKRKRIEWEALPPDTMRYVYESTATTRSVPRFVGVVIQSGFSLENGTVYSWPMADPLLQKQFDVKERLELITPERWIVLLDGELTPVSPVDKNDQWMPSENGVNPYQSIPVPLFNGKRTHEHFLGMSDIWNINDVQVINELFSDVVYMHRMYVPVPYLKSQNRDSKRNFTLGIGAGVSMSPGDEFGFANANINWNGVLEPLRIFLETFYSNSKAPAVAVGLGHLFGDQQRVSGKAKVFEWKPTIAHAEAKQPTFRKGVQSHYRSWATIASTPPPFGQGLNVDVDAEAEVTFDSSIVPIDQAEKIDNLVKETAAQMKARITGIMEANNWSAERAAAELDLMRVEDGYMSVGAPWASILEAVEERKDRKLTEQEKDALFGAREPSQMDALGVGGESGEQT